MTDFAKWLGWHNADALFSSAFSRDLTKEQARAVVTTHCILFDIEVDTYDWNCLMHDLFENYNCWFDTFDEFDGYMCGLMI